MCFVSDTAVIYTEEQIEVCLRHVCGAAVCRAETSACPLDDNIAYTVFICHLHMFRDVAISVFYSVKSNCWSCQRSVQSNAKRQITFIIFTDRINASNRHTMSSEIK